jgi:hypothetical protein
LKPIDFVDGRALVVEPQLFMVCTHSFTWVTGGWLDAMVTSWRPLT